MPTCICYEIGVQTRGCPITGIQLQKVLIGYHTICTSIMCVFLLLSFLMLPIVYNFYLWKALLNIFSSKYFSKDYFNFEICYRCD